MNMTLVEGSFGGVLLDGQLPSHYFGRLIFLPLLVLTRRGAAPVKTNAGNKFPRKMPENSENVLPVLVLNFGYIFALQYCTGNF